MSKEVINALNNRVWYVPNGVHPSREVQILSLGKFGDPSQSRGDATRIGAPDPNNFEQDIEVGSTPGSRERGTLTVSARYTVNPAILLNLFRTGCRVDFFSLTGKCGDPNNFSKGGEKRTYFRDAQPSTITWENFGAFSTDENNPTNENLDLSTQDFWEYLYLSVDQLFSAVTTREVRTIDVCDAISCGDCGDASDGCEKYFATMVGVGATPGTLPILIYSRDAGLTSATENISTLTSTESVADGECIAGDLVLITNEGNEFHYRNINELFTGQGDWAQVDTGFVVGGEPNRMHSVDARHTWVVGNGGYIYFTRNPRTGVTVQDAGVATTENLLYVHAFDTENVLAVGENNTVLVSRNGGDTWNTRTGPTPGEFLSICWMWDAQTWIVGTGAGGGGTLWYTDDGGFTWNAITLPVDVARFDAIRFSSEAEGLITGRTGGNNAVTLRTITGGNEWIVVPDSPNAGAVLATDYLRDIAVCEEDSNVALFAGLADDGTAGVVLKAAG